MGQERSILSSIPILLNRQVHNNKDPVRPQHRCDKHLHTLSRVDRLSSRDIRSILACKPNNSNRRNRWHAPSPSRCSRSQDSMVWLEGLSTCSRAWKSRTHTQWRG